MGHPIADWNEKEREERGEEDKKKRERERENIYPTVIYLSICRYFSNKRYN